MSSNSHTIYIEQGAVGTPAEANKNPSVAQNQQTAKGSSPMGTALKATALIQAGKGIMNNTVSNIGFATGNYELQEQIETATKIIGVGFGLIVAPAPTLIAGSISLGFQLWQNSVVQQRAVYKQQQNQILTGKISVNGGRWT